MNQQTWHKILHKHRAIAVIRASDLELGVTMAESVASGGMGLIEVTWNSENPAKLVSKLRKKLPDCVIGVGTLLKVEQLKKAVDNGAQFCFSPHCHLKLMQAALEAKVPMIPGALSPTEIITAWSQGASSVKVFPVEAMGGTKYIKSLQGPLGEIPLIPTGGVTLENALEFLKSGAIAVGLSGDLFPPSVMLERDWQAIAERANQLCRNLQSFCH